MVRSNEFQKMSCEYQFFMSTVSVEYVLVGFSFVFCFGGGMLSCVSLLKFVTAQNFFVVVKFWSWCFSFVNYLPQCSAGNFDLFIFLVRSGNYDTRVFIVLGFFFFKYFKIFWHKCVTCHSWTGVDKFTEKKEKRKG